MLTTTLYHWCEAREIAKPFDINIPDDFFCALPFDAKKGRGIAIQLIDSNRIATTVLFQGAAGPLEADAQEWSEDGEID